MKQPWLASAGVDSAFILAPPFAATLAAWLLHGRLGYEEVPLWGWVLLVVAVDVSHVYSTLFRTYFDLDELKARPALYLLTPLFCWLGGVLAYSASPLWFWRVLAYVAVFHFVRQQYGFMRLYTRREKQKGWSRTLDAAVIYLATLYPLAYWHAHLPRHFEWFVAGDFSARAPAWISPVALALFVSTLAAYTWKEWRGGEINIPKQAVLLSTSLSWGVGIVAFNADLAFTLTNVLAHGIPYMALVWIHGRKRAEKRRQSKVLGLWPALKFFTPRLLPLFVGLLFLFGWLEEGFWDGLIWREHASAFGLFQNLPQVLDTTMLGWLVPLLALPQATHYVLDGFIWRLRPGPGRIQD